MNGPEAQQEEVEQGAPLEQAPQEPAPEQEGEAGAQESPGVAELSELLRARDARTADLEEHVKRLSAEFANFRRRQQEEQRRHLSRMKEDLFRTLLPVVDNLERALAASRGEASAESLMKGVELVEREVRKILEDHGVRPILADGEPFDPGLHEAVMTEEREDVPDQTVVQELQRGYTMEDRVLRPSMVKVARAQ